MAGKKSTGNRSQAIRDFWAVSPNSKAGEVITGLSKKGITVSADLVYAVKRKMGGKKGGRKQTATNAASVSSNGTGQTASSSSVVAQRNGKPNKSEQIRDYLEANPSATAPQAITALSKNGVQVTPSLVYSIKAKMGSGKSSGKQPSKSSPSATTNGAVASTSGSNDVVSIIRKVKGLASEVGGLKKLMALVEALSA